LPQAAETAANHNSDELSRTSPVNYAAAHQLRTYGSEDYHAYLLNHDDDITCQLVERLK